MSQYYEEAGESLGPWQLAVAVSSGAEVAQVLIEFILSICKTAVGITDDVENGYGAVDRPKMLAVVAATVDKLSPFMEANYGRTVGHSKVLYTNSAGKQAWLKSSKAIRQGAVDSAFGFTSVGTEKRAAGNAIFATLDALGCVMDYIDDTFTIAAHKDDEIPADPRVQHPAITACLSNMEHNKAMGMFPAPGKLKFIANSREAFPPSQVTPIVDWIRANVPGQAGWAGPVIVKPGDPPPPPKTATLVYLSDVNDGTTTAAGLTFLGRPQGTNAFKEEAAEVAADKAIAVLKAQSRLQLAKQTQFQITKFCVISKLGHMLRSVPPALTAKAVDKFEEAMRGDSDAAWVWNHLDIAPKSVTPAELARIGAVTHLGHGDGGLALTNLKEVQRYAYFCGFSDALNTKLAGKMDLAAKMRNQDSAVVPMLAAVQTQLVAFRAFLGLTAYESLTDDAREQLSKDERARLEFARRWVPTGIEEMLDETARGGEKYEPKAKGGRKLTMQATMGICTNEKLQADYQVSLAILKPRCWLANYLDQMQAEASSWLKIMPGDASLRFTDDQWTSSARNFVAISDDRMVPGRTCACGQEFTDSHAENCKRWW